MFEFDGFLSIGESKVGLPGGGTDPDHPDAFSIRSFELQVTQTPNFDGDLIYTFQPIIVDIDQTEGRSGLFSENVVGKTIYDTITLDLVVDADAKAERPIQTITLSDARIASYGETNLNTGRIALEFAAIQIDIFTDPRGDGNFEAETFSGTLDPQNENDVAIDLEKATPGIAFPVVEDANPPTALLKVEGLKGDSDQEGYEDYFSVSDFNFSVTKELIETSPGKFEEQTTIDPITIDLSSNALSSRFLDFETIRDLDIFQLQVGGKTPLKLEVIDIDNVQIQSFVRDDDFETRIGLGDFSSVKQTSKVENQFGESEVTAENVTVVDADLGDSNYSRPAFDVSPEVEAFSTDRYFLKVPGVDGGFDSTDDFLDGSFELAGYGYAINGADGVSDAQFSGLTVDFLNNTSGLSQVLEGLTDTTVFSKEVVLERRLEDMKTTIETIKLTDAAFDSVAIDSDLATRAVLDFHAVRINNFLFGDKGEQEGKVDFEFDRGESFVGLTEHIATSVGPREEALEPELLGYIQLGSIKGSSNAENFENRFEVSGLDLEIFFAEVDGGTAPVFTPLTVDLAPDDPKIAQILGLFGSGSETTLGDVQLDVVQGAGAQIYKLTDAFVLGVDIGSDRATSVALGYNGIKITSIDLGESGSTATEAVFEYNHAKMGGILEQQGPSASTTQVANDDDLFLKIDNIDGGTLDADFEGAFDVEAFELSVAAFSQDLNSANSPLNYDFSALTVDILPGLEGNLLLMDALANGTDLGSITLSLSGSEDKADTYTFEDATVLSFEVNDGNTTRVNFGYSQFDVKLQAVVNGSPAEIRAENIAHSTDLSELSFGRGDGVELGFETRAFLEFPNQKIEGLSIDANHEGQIEIFDFELDLEGLRNVSGDGDAEVDVDLSPLVVRVPSYEPGLLQILKTSEGGTAFPSVQLNVARQLSQGFEDFDRTKLLNVQVLDYYQEGDSVTLVLGYSQLTRAVRGVDATGAFTEAVQTIDFGTDDLVLGDAANNELVGGNGNDTLFGGAGDDTVNGGAGNDEFNAASGLGDDVYDGGNDRDVITFRSSSLGVEVDLEDGFSTGTEIGLDEIINIEDVVGGSGGDTIRGSSVANALAGENGSDVLEGSGGNDTLDGGSGNDTLSGGEGSDVYLPGSGADVIVDSIDGLSGDRVIGFDAEDVIIIDDVFAPSQITISSGSAILGFDADGDGTSEGELTLEGDYDSATFEVTTLGDVSEIRISAPGTTLLTQAADRFITTDELSNRVFGFDNDDFVLTSGGDDFLSGSIGSDVLLGGDGADQLRGGLDNDVLTGAAGADVFVFDSSDFDGFTVDTITDFTPGEDILSLTGFGDVTSILAAAIELPDALLIPADGSGFVRLDGVARADLTSSDIVTPTALATQEFLQIIRYTQLSSAADRFITSNDGPNLVEADGGDDFVLTDDGTDEIFGGTGSDVLLGGASSDMLNGGPGNDVLTGGTGSDEFVFDIGDETGFVVDTITDFEIGTDRVVLNGASTLPTIISLGGEGAAQIGATHFIRFETLSATEVEDNAAVVFELG